MPTSRRLSVEEYAALLSSDEKLADPAFNVEKEEVAKIIAAALARDVVKLAERHGLFVPENIVTEKEIARAITNDMARLMHRVLLNFKVRPCSLPISQISTA